MSPAITIASKPKKNIPLVFFLFKGESPERKGLWKFLGRAERNYLTGAVIIKELRSLKEGGVKMSIMPGTNRHVIAIGLGKKEAAQSPKKIALALRTVVQAACKERIDRFAYEARSPGDRQATIDAYEVAASNIVMADFEFDDYKTPTPEGPRTIKEVQLVVIAKEQEDAIEEGVRRGLIIGEETNACRTLQNMPGGDMTPDVLAKHAQETAKRVGGKAGSVKVTVLGVPEMKKLGMGGVLGVGQGSAVPPRFIIMEYMPNMKGAKGPNAEKPVVLVGKGVTFDTGGLNLKPSDHIYEMHMDMSGGAAVIHALAAAVRLGIKKNIVALVPAVENMPSGSSYRPGDLLRTMNGKTIEVLNTDAEGRVILADALEYSKKYDPSLVVDVATLTGAAMAALGLRYTGLFTPDAELEKKFRALGDAVADPVWPLPLSEDYENDIKGTFADWANAGKPGAGGGASTAATFLWQFTKDAKGKQEYPWVHLDIAPRMTSIEEEHLAKGGLGTPVRLLARLLEGE